METGFDALVISQVAAIRRIGRRRLKNRNDLDDFTQEVLTRLFASRAQLREASRLPQWAARIARNTASDWNRQERVRVPEECLSNLPHPAPSAQWRMEESERWRALWEALNGLEPRDRDLLCSYYLNEESAAELAYRHRLTQEALRARLSRARRRVRERLAETLSAFALLFGVRRAEAMGGGFLMTLQKGIVIGGCVLLGLALVGGGTVAVFHANNVRRQKAETTAQTEADSQQWVKEDALTKESDASFNPRVKSDSSKEATLQNRTDTTQQTDESASDRSETQRTENRVSAQSKKSATAPEASKATEERRAELTRLIVRSRSLREQIVKARDAIDRTYSADGKGRADWKDVPPATREAVRRLYEEVESIQTRLAELAPESVVTENTPKGPTTYVDENRVIRDNQLSIASSE